MAGKNGFSGNLAKRGVSGHHILQYLFFICGLWYPSVKSFASMQFIPKGLGKRLSACLESSAHVAL